MQHFTSLLAGCGVTVLPLRPLLCAAGAAVTTAGVYYYMQKKGEQRGYAEGAADTAHTSLSHGQVPGHEFSITETDSSVSSEAKVSRDLGMMMLQELLNEAYRKCETKTKECEEERRMKEAELHNEMSLMASLNEAVEAHHQAMESNAVLEREKTDLMHHVHKLSYMVRDLERMSYEADITRGVIKQDLESAREAYSALRSEHEETLKQRDELLKECEREREARSVLQSECDEMKVTLADLKLKYEDEMKRTAQLEQERSEHECRLRAVVERVEEHVDRTVRINESLKQELESARDAHSVLRSEHEETLKQRDELLKECERECEARSVLQSECDEMKERISDNETSLMVSLKEAVEAHHQAMESNAVLEREKTDLMDHVHKLSYMVRDLERMFCEADITCGVIKQERERTREACSILRSEYEEVIRQRGELAVLLAEAEKKNETAMESSGPLTSEGNLLETREMCDGTTMTKTKGDREALSIRKMPHDEVKAH